MVSSQFDELKNLLSKKEIDRLKVDGVNLPEKFKSVEYSAPIKVRRHEVGREKHCDIDVHFVLLSEEDQFINITLRFHREYTEGRLPEWTIIKFNVEQ